MRRRLASGYFYFFPFFFFIIFLPFGSGGVLDAEKKVWKKKESRSDDIFCND